MFFSSVFVLEPVLIFSSEVLWNALIANLAQRWSFGAHALAGTTRYLDVVRTIEQQFIKNLRVVAATRVQRWFFAVLEMYRAINEQVPSSVNFQAITSKTVHQKKYVKDRKWCLKVEVEECYDLEQVQMEDLMSPLIRLECDVGNPTVLQTKVAWDAHKRASFNEIFFLDIKESQALYVSVWSKTPSSYEFIGRGYFEFSQLKSGDRDKPGGQDLKVTLHDIEHGEKRSRMKKVHGNVNLRVKFIDPSKESTGDGRDSEDTTWMLPKHRMQFALSKMGGRMKVSKMLGGLGTPMMAPVPVKVPSGPLKLDTGSGWQVGGPSKFGSTVSSSNHTPTGRDVKTPVSPEPTYRSRPGSQPGPVISAETAHAADTADPLPPPSAAPPQASQAASLSLNSADPVDVASPGSPGSGPAQATSQELPGAVPDDDDGA